jgi:hypothetical protein
MSDFKAPRWFSAWAYDEDDSFAGIFAIEFKYWFDGYVTILVLDQRCMTKNVLRAIFTAAFAQARRLTAEIEPHNRRALRQVQRLGWQYEGMRRLGIEGKRDVLCYGMLKSECRYLSGYVRPSAPLLNVGDRVLVDPVLGSDQPPIPFVGADRSDLFDGQGGDVMGLALADTFKQVGAAGLPANVDRANTAGSAATMRSVHRTGGRPVHSGADETVDLPASLVREIPHLRVSSRVNGKRPKQAVVSSVGNSVSKETLRGHNLSLTEIKNYEQ